MSMLFSSQGDDTFSDSLMTGASSTLINALTSNQSFFNFEAFFLPRSVKELFAHSRHMFMTNDAINPALEKLAEYPVTEFVFSPVVQGQEDTEEYRQAYKQKESIIKTWQNLFDTHLMAKGFAVSLLLNYLVYGNAFVSVYRPFDRILVCGNPDCGEHHLLSKVKWTWEKAKMAFKIEKCTKCGFKGLAKFYDKPVSDDPTRINLISYYPGHIDIDYDPYSGCREYYLLISADQVKKIKDGNPLMLAKTPREVIEAVKGYRGKMQTHTSFLDTSNQGPKVKLRSDNIFHLARHTISMPSAESPWGMPVTVSSLRNIFYLNMMKRAQVALLLDHIVPYRFLFPGTDVGMNTTVPIDLADWRKRMQGELKKWRRDPLYVMLSPIPLGQDQVGGQGKALMLFPEMQQVRQEILNGVNVPIEFVQGGLQYTGTSVSLRMLENSMLNMVEQLVKCFKWITKRISSVTNLEYVDVDLKRFKMSDDVQQRQLAMNLWQSQVVSGEWLGQVCEFSYTDERKKRVQENLAQAVADAKAQAKAMQAGTAIQSILQNTLPPEALNTQPTVDPGMVDQIYQGIKGMDPEQQQNYLAQIGQTNPDVARLVSEKALYDPSSMAQNIQALMGMSPPEQAGFFQQMQQQNPGMALVMANIAKNFGTAIPQQQGQDVEKSMPNQKPPNRKGGSPM